MSRSVDEGKRAVWRQRLARYARGGQTVSAFCTAEGVSVQTFYQWKRKLAQELSTSAWPRSGGTPRAETRTFVPVRIGAASVVEIELPNGARIRVPSGDGAAIGAAIRAAGRVPASSEQEPPRC